MKINSKSPIYIVYDPSTMQAIRSFTAYGPVIHSFLRDNPCYRWVNITHPATKEIVRKLMKETEK